MALIDQAKPLRDAYPALAWQQVKLALRQTVAKAGGVDAVAALFDSTKLNAGRVSEWKSPDHPTLMPNLWQAAQIEAAAGVDWITQAMAALHHADLVKRPTADEPVELTMQTLGRLVTEAGEAMQVAAAALADGKITPQESRALRDELLQVVRCATELIAGLDHGLDAACTPKA